MRLINQKIINVFEDYEKDYIWCFIWVKHFLKWNTTRIYSLFKKYLKSYNEKTLLTLNKFKYLFLSMYTRQIYFWWQASKYLLCFLQYATKSNIQCNLILFHKFKIYENFTFKTKKWTYRGVVHTFQFQTWKSCTCVKVLKIFETLFPAKHSR